LKIENQVLIERLKKYTAPTRYKKYYEENKKEILEKKKQMRLEKQNNKVSIRINTVKMTYKELVKKVSKLSENFAVKDLAMSYGLDVNKVVWEDTFRYKNSCLGGNISDLTLTVDDTRMCMIRKPNYTDITADLPSESFNLTITGDDGNLKTVLLKEYIKGLSDNLWIERDKDLLVSAQCCVLPCDKTGSVEFCPTLFNYQNNVLVVTSTSQGTSSQVMSGRDNLYFNSGNTKRKFIAKRLTQDRIERKVSTTGAMTSEEEERNVIIIYQIPLQRKRQRRGAVDFKYGMCGGLDPSGFASVGETYSSYITDDNMFDGDDGDDGCLSSGFGAVTLNCSGTPRGGSAFIEGCSLDGQLGGKRVGSEDAMLSFGTTEYGRFKELKTSELKRDPNSPIRVTYQFYKVTDTNELKQDDIEYMSRKINGIYEKAKTMGSLVVSSTIRPTSTQSSRVHVSPGSFGLRI
jgi:hypothetical protein